MRHHHRLVIAAGCLAVLAASTPAFTEPLFSFSTSPALVSEARKYMGTNPTARKKLWCATFMNMVLAKTGYAGTNSDAAKSFAYYGRRVTEPQVGAIAVLTRGKRGGHVGIVSGIDKNGNPVIISGNHNKRVGEATYSRARVIAYVMPTDRRSTMQFAARSNSASSEPVLESPITELLAAIEAETNRSASPARQAQQLPQPRRVTQQATNRDIDPFLAELLEKVRGRTEQPAQTTQPVRAKEPPLRQQRVQQTAADSHLSRTVSATR